MPHFQKRPHRNMNLRITQANVLKGIRHSEIAGTHKQERYVNVVGPNVRTIDLNRKGKKLDTETDLDVKGGSEIDYKKAAENEFMASNSDMRGKQQAKVFRGNRVYDWSPERDFKPEAVGYVQGGGAFQGGFINQALEKKARFGYLKPMGHAKGGVGHGGVALNNVNPFSINLRVKAGDL